MTRHGHPSVPVLARDGWQLPAVWSTTQSVLWHGDSVLGPRRRPIACSSSPPRGPAGRQMATATGSAIPTTRTIWFWPPRDTSARTNSNRANRHVRMWVTNDEALPRQSPSG